MSQRPDNQTRRRCRQIAHHLKPIVTIGERGLTDAVVDETQRALLDHELIKVRIIDERAARERLSTALALRCDAQIIQQMGKTLVLLRENSSPNIQLSNLHRYTTR